MTRDTQTGFGFEAGPGFDFGGQSGFTFDPESEWEATQREAKRARQAREERQRQQEARDRKAREQQERQRSQRQAHWGDDPYDILGIPRTASTMEIRAAWVRLCKELHPDAGGDVRKMQAVNAAYNRLKGRR